MKNRCFKIFEDRVDPRVSIGEKSNDEIMRNAINVQIEIQNGKVLTDVKGVPLKSWFN